MSEVDVLVKWKGKTVEAIRIKPDETVLTLKLLLQEKTGVEVGNQKLFMKGKVLNLEDVVGQVYKPNDSIMMMGTASTSIPRTRTHEESNGTKEVAQSKSEVSIKEPCGLLNLGNTCYMNSVIQLVKLFPNKSLSELNSSDKTNLNESLTKLLISMKNNTSLSPMEFLLSLRKNHPQFSEKDASGFFSQQDAHECLQAILSSLSCSKSSAFTLPFEGESQISIERDNDVPSFSIENFTELTCHIKQDTSELVQGIKESLLETIVGENNQKITKKTLIQRAPDLLFIKFVRFFWKQKEQVKAKILKKVKFPKTLDLSPYMTSSGNQAVEYNLKAVLTHCGRSADSGHYISWINESGNWWKMDDDKVSAVSEEDIMKLDGGGDWHMAYICLYEKINNQ